MQWQGRALASRYLEEKGVKRELDIYYFQFSVYHEENQRILNWYKGLFPYYIISYNKQGSFQMIIEDYNKGPRVVRKDYVL